MSDEFIDERSGLVLTRSEKAIGAARHKIRQRGRQMQRCTLRSSDLLALAQPIAEAST